MPPPTKIVVHRPAEVVPVLKDLLGRQVAIKELPPVKSTDGMYVIGTYDREDGSLAAACALDLQLSASLSAALTLVPSGIADESVRAGKLEEMLEENLHEVLNVAGRFFNSLKSPRVIFKWKGPPPLEPVKHKFFLTSPTRHAMEVTVTGYKPGKMIFVAN